MVSLTTGKNTSKQDYATPMDRKQGVGMKREALRIRFEDGSTLDIVEKNLPPVRRHLPPPQRRILHLLAHGGLYCQCPLHPRPKSDKQSIAAMKKKGWVKDVTPCRGDPHVQLLGLTDEGRRQWEERQR